MKMADEHLDGFRTLAERIEKDPHEVLSRPDVDTILCCATEPALAGQIKPGVMLRMLDGIFGNSHKQRPETLLSAAMLSHELLADPETKITDSNRLNFAVRTANYMEDWASWAGAADVKLTIAEEESRLEAQYDLAHRPDIFFAKAQPIDPRKAEFHHEVAAQAKAFSEMGRKLTRLAADILQDPDAEISPMEKFAQASNLIFNLAQQDDTVCNTVENIILKDARDPTVATRDNKTVYGLEIANIEFPGSERQAAALQLVSQSMVDFVGSDKVYAKELLQSWSHNRDNNSGVHDYIRQQLWHLSPVSRTLRFLGLDVGRDSIAAGIEQLQSENGLHVVPMVPYAPK